MILQIQHSKLDATKIDTESAIFVHVMNELRHTNGFLDTTVTHVNKNEKVSKNELLGLSFQI